MKAYDLVKSILTINEQARNSDKVLIVEILKRQGYVKQVSYFDVIRDVVMLDALTSAKFPNFETIRRARQKVQELCPELQATSSLVRSRRKQKQETKSTFVFREKL